VGDVIPMKREQTPEDIGRAAVFLASEDARNITGQALQGGRRSGISPREEGNSRIPSPPEGERAG
jgi:NAD(P)-dependent dehydrogenase (short-subunit alcohol dehydrogenase family)